MAKKKDSPRIAFRLTEREKKQVPGLASRCGLTLSECLRPRALGYEPKAVQPDACFVPCVAIGEGARLRYAKRHRSHPLSIPPQLINRTR